MAASLLTLILIVSKGQEPEKKQQPVQDTTVVQIERHVAERPADTLYLKQSLAMDKLDSLIQEKQKK